MSRTNSTVVMAAVLLIFVVGAVWAATSVSYGRITAVNRVSQHSRGAQTSGTIMGGMIFGLSRQVATEFSFFLAVPIMFAATGYQLVKYRSLLTADDLAGFAVGFVVSFVFALIAVKALIRYVAHHDFNAFAWYRIALGAVVLWYFR